MKVVCVCVFGEFRLLQRAESGGNRFDVCKSKR